MKKAICILTSLALLAGCGKSESSLSSVPESVEEEPAKFSVWAVEPEMKFDTVRPIEAYPNSTMLYKTARGGDQLVVIDSNKTGYGSQWNGSRYSGNAVIVEINGMAGIYDYYGNELYPAEIRVSTTLFSRGITAGIWVHKDSGSTEFAIGASDTSVSKAYIFTENFNEVRETDIREFALDPIDRNSLSAQLCIQNGVLGVLYRVRDDNGNLTAEQAFDIYDGQKLPSGGIVPVIDGQFSKTGLAVIDEEGNYISQVNQSRGKYVENSYINGYYRVADEKQTSLIDARTGGQMTLDYHDILYYSDGYCPVKKYGKWGFIDENGKEVTDFIFDVVSPVYQGKAYVLKGDRWGILNIQGTLGSNEQITLTNCYGTEESDPVGSIKVNVSGLNFRDNPGTGGAMIGIAMEGSEYPVFEVKKDDNYTWYRIDTSYWLADNGSWLTYTKN